MAKTKAQSLTEIPQWAKTLLSKTILFSKPTLPNIIPSCGTFQIVI